MMERCRKMERWRDREREGGGGWEKWVGEKMEEVELWRDRRVERWKEREGGMKRWKSREVA